MRMYENMWEVFLRYLIHSSEKPLGGTVSGLVDRTELHAKVGAANLPHHHLAIWLEENDGTEAGKQKLLIISEAVSIVLLGVTKLRS